MVAPQFSNWHAEIRSSRLSQPISLQDFLSGPLPELRDKLMPGRGGKREPFVRIYLPDGSDRIFVYIHLVSTYGGLTRKLETVCEKYGMKLETLDATEVGDVEGPLNVPSALVRGHHQVPAISGKCYIKDNDCDRMLSIVMGCILRPESKLARLPLDVVRQHIAPLVLTTPIARPGKVYPSEEVYIYPGAGAYVEIGQPKAKRTRPSARSQTLLSAPKAKRTRPTSRGQTLLSANVDDPAGGLDLFGDTNFDTGVIQGGLELLSGTSIGAWVDEPAGGLELFGDTNFDTGGLELHSGTSLESGRASTTERVERIV